MIKIIRQPIITVLGHVDHGKCVIPNTNIPLVDGRILSAIDIFREYSASAKKEEIKGGEVYAIQDGPEIFSFDQKGSIKKKISHVWRLKAPEKLIKVKIRSGDEVTVTPEHPFFVLTHNLMIKKKQAKDIREEDFIIVPKILRQESNLSKIKSHILERIGSRENFVVFLNKKNGVEFIKRLSSENMQDLYRKGLFSTHPSSCKKYSRFRARDFAKLSKYFGFSELESYNMISYIKNSSEGWRAGHTSNKIRLPQTEKDFEMFGYILGSLAGDGYITEGILHNNDKEIQVRYQKYVKAVLNLASEVKEGHTCQMVRTNGGKSFTRLLIDIVGFPSTEKSSNVDVPLIVQMFQPMFKTFIEGLFDTDGYVSHINYSIEITSKSRKLLEKVGVNLLNYKIHSVIYTKSGFYNLRIANKEYINRFLNTFNPALSRKVERILKANTKATTSRVFDLTPADGAIIRKIKISNKDMAFFNKYKNYSNLSRPFFRKLINFIEDTDFQNKLRFVLNQDVSFVKVVSKEIINPKDKYVYDFTVLDTHNFVAERMFIHNTTLLDYIRGTTLAQREAGKITQHIGATEVPIGTLQKVCGGLLEVFKLQFTIPGLLFIDTPGHEAFTNLRKRGGSIADLAVLIIDINQGVQPQTKEAVQILKTFKVPFVVAATKIDVLSGWKSHDKMFLTNLKQQIDMAKKAYEDRFYKLLGQLSELGFSSNIYNKVDNYSKEVAIVPVSGQTGEGVAELLALLTGLSQKFLKDRLEVDVKKPAEGTVLEIKEEKGMGTTADVIIYAGSLTKDDTIVIGGANVFETKIRSLLKPNPLSEIRDKKSRFKHIDKVVAAAGIKILAHDLDKALAGAPFASARNEKQIENARRKILDEVEQVLVETDEEGVILKADTLGSIEAAANLLKQKGIPIKRADIGAINKQDVLEAASQKQNLEAGFVLGFNVKYPVSVKKEAEKEKVPVINHPVIYKIVEEYEERIEELKKEKELEKLRGLTWPGKFRILPQYIFRQSGPAIFGAEVLAGRVKAGVSVMNKDGIAVGEIKSIEDQGKKIEELKQGEQAAFSVNGITIGRNVEAGDVLYVDVPEAAFKKLKDVRQLLSGQEKTVLKEIAEIHRREKDIWGI